MTAFALPLLMAFTKTGTGAGILSATSFHKHNNMLTNKGHWGRPQMNIESSVAFHVRGRVSNNLQRSTDIPAKDAIPHSSQRVPPERVNTSLWAMLPMM